MILLNFKLNTMKKLETIMKGLIMSLLAIGLLTFSGCGPEPVDPIPEVVPTETIYELIQSTADLDSLAKYIEIYPDLTGLLGADGSNTFFAPNNSAFISLLQTPGFPAEIASINPDIIKGVLAYHIVAGQEVLQAELTGSYNTLFTDPSTSTVQIIEMNADGTLFTGSSNDAIAIVTGDVKATNGVMHITGSVLIPPSVGATLTVLLGTVAGTIHLGADFTTMAQLITMADIAAATAGETPPTNILASANDGNGWTMFVPSNGVFEGMAALGGVTVDQFMASINDPYAAVLGMISSGKLVSTEFTHGKQITDLGQRTFTLAATDVTAQTPTGWVLVSNTDPNASPAPLYLLDINHGNGVIHVSAVLMD